MAKFHGLIKGDIKGNAGQLAFRQQAGMTIVSGRVYTNRSKGDGATLAQRIQRTKLAGLLNLYKAIRAFEAKAWEGKAANVSDYNMFVKKNLTAANVYFTKEQANLGACVPMRVLVSQGSLSAPQVDWLTEKVHTNLLITTGSPAGITTVGQLSQAIIENNVGYKNGDKITFGLLRKVWNTISGVRVPSVTVEYIEFVLNTENGEYITALASAHAHIEMIQIGSAYYLGVVAEGDAAMLVHTREDAAMLLTSTQTMVLNVSSASNEYSTYEAMMAAADSYGYKDTVLIQPSGEVESFHVQANATGHATAYGSGDYPAGSNVELRTEGESTYTFKGWFNNNTGTGTPLSRDVVYTIVNLQADTTVYAVWDAQ